MAQNEKLDPFKQHEDEYAASKVKPQLVQTTAAQYLAIEGSGEPGGELFQAKIGGLYAMAFTIKMTRKFAGKGDYKVAPLEGIWWAGESGMAFDETPRDQWRWKLLIRTPDVVTDDDLAAARAALEKKNKPPEFNEVTLDTVEEGPCVQMLHVGPYATEPETIAKMQQFMDENALTLAGPHHEIYLSDPRRVPPERIKTILRAPAKPADG